jgi:hypothetical protein
MQIKRWGKARRLRSKMALAHKPNGHAIGKWHSRSTLWAYKRKSRRKRLIADASRRANRGAA